MDKAAREITEAVVSLELYRRCNVLQEIAKGMCAAPRCDAATAAVVMDTERAMRTVEVRCNLSANMSYKEVAEHLSNAVDEFVTIARGRASENDAIRKHNAPRRSRRQLYERAFPYILGQAIDVELELAPVAIAQFDDGEVRVTAAGAIAPSKLLTCMPTHRLFFKNCKSAPWTSRKCVASLGGTRDAYEGELHGLDRRADVLYCSDPRIFRAGSCAHVLRKSADVRLVNACIVTFLGGVARVAVSIRDIAPGELICIYRCD